MHEQCTCMYNQCTVSLLCDRTRSPALVLLEQMSETKVMRQNRTYKACVLHMCTGSTHLPCLSVAPPLLSATTLQYRWLTIETVPLLYCLQQYPESGREGEGEKYLKER